MERERAHGQPDRRASAPLGRAAQHPAVALQRALGNRATRAVLARQPDEPQVLASTVTLDGIGTIELESLSWGQNGELDVASKIGAHSPQLAQANAKGKSFDTVTILLKGRTITLKGVIIGDYQAGGEREQWSLNYESIAYGEPPTPGKLD